MSDFRFANPQWSIAFWGVVVVVVLLMWLEQRRSHVLQKFLQSTMHSRLVTRQSLIRRLTVILLMGFAGVSLVIALMRPQYGLTFIKAPRVGAQIMFCLDVSNSMLAEDVAPNRLDRAKADISDLLTFLDGDQVGLIGFAGRAAVLCPLTPDYGFFKLILDDAKPSSVGRGGTRLEEPLRKALDGFRSESDVSRIVVLITDGEDHDSHPLDVAKEAIERGVRVISIGFGDESGSEIRITDPATGVQKTVRDSSGQPVVTRLDGEMLREIALATEGVYIPAGTGSLDLKSIYDVHIEPLVRGELQTEGRAVRKEAFQWAILAGILFLVASVFVASGSSESKESRQQAFSPAVRAAAVGLFVVVPLSTGNVLAEDAADSNSEAKPNPRETYNQGLANLNQELDKAEELLTTARRESGADGEVRFRSTYNMGWVEIRRADSLIKEKPSEALAHLQAAAGWFRDAIRLRKDDSDARHNLEIILRRIVQLRDRLSQKGDHNLQQMLDTAIENQRSITASARELVDRVTESDDPNIVDQFRGEFQKLAVDERTLLSKMQDVVEKASGEISSLTAKSDEDRTTEDTIRLGQLQGVLSYVNEANQRLGQTRSQFRRRQATRGFRRSSLGLQSLKRARDQLRGPLELIDGLLSDSVTTLKETSMKSRDTPIVTTENNGPHTPSWITQDYLEDSQSDISTRSAELANRLAAGLKAANEHADEDKGETKQTPEDSAQREAFAEQLRDAVPFLRTASQAMEAALSKIGSSEFDGASRDQVKGIEALQEARERFADVKALIELAYKAQTQIAAFLLADTEGDQSESSKSELIEYVSTVVNPIQSKNLERMTRLRKLVQRQSESLESIKKNEEAEDNTGPNPEKQRMETALSLIEMATTQMQKVTASFPASDKNVSETKLEADDEKATGDTVQPKESTEKTEQGNGEESAPGDEGQTAKRDNNAEETVAIPSVFVDSRGHADESIKTLEQLRRLFFSLVEHLRDTVRRQASLNDDTEQAAGVLAEQNSSDDDSILPHARRFQSRQEELSQISDQIAKALRQQSQVAIDNGANPQRQAQSQDQSKKANLAANYVAEAKTEMDKAVNVLSSDAPSLDDSRPLQDKALEKLIQAIRELEPPQQNDQNQQDPNQQNQGDNQQQSEEDGKQQTQPESTKGQQSEQNDQSTKKMDPSRILQAVRDREAQRRRDKDRRQSANSVPVEKDW